MNIRPTVSIVALAIALFVPFRAQPTAADGQPVSVLTGRYNNERTGANVSETILNDSNVNIRQFGKLFSRTVVGHIYAQPLYVPNVTLPGLGQHNVVYVATMHNMLYAFDADDPARADPFWVASLGTPFTHDVFSDIPGGEDGILSTPVIDQQTQTIYLVSRNAADNNAATYNLHALDIATGRPKFNSPAEIKLSMKGSGYAAVRGILTLDASNQLQRTALLLFNGNLYFGFSANNDLGLWYGWLPAYDAHDLSKQTGLWNAAPDGQSGGIWMTGSGIATDGTYLYFGTGNGSFNAHLGGRNYAMSVIKMQHTGTMMKVVDWFTPYDYKDLDAKDIDMGAGGLVLIPGTNLLVAAGKNGYFYVIDRTQMGHFDAKTDSSLQVFQVGKGLLYCAPVYWETGPGGQPTVYSWDSFDPIQAYTVDKASKKINTTPTSISAVRALGRPGGAFSLSANGTTAGTGIIWAIHAAHLDRGDNSAVLYALDATDLQKVLWHSEMKAERDAIGIMAKFNPPTVANGKVYVGSFSNQMVVFGLLNASK